jgi:glycosyltransferase involved in cell wall biosynthesis
VTRPSALVILDPGLHMIAGHHFELDTALLAAAAELGVPGHIFGHRTSNPHLNDDPRITPFFGVLGAATATDPMLVDLDRFTVENQRLFDDLARVGDALDMANSVLLFATATHNSLAGLGRWTRTWRTPPRHLFVLLPGHFEYALAGGAGRLDQLFYRYGFSLFPEAEGSSVSFLTLSERQAAEFSAIAGRPVERAPYPVGELDGSAPPPNQRMSGRPRILLCGSSRDSKGFGLLPDVMRLLASRRPGAEFVVQYCPTEDVTIAEIANAGATVVEGYLDRAAYHALIRSADVLLLPYIGPAYKVGTSAVFAEARWFGRPVVVASGTSLADDVAADPRLGLVALPDPRTLTEALATILDNYDSFAAGALDAAADYRLKNGTRRFAARLLDPP